jgi:3-phytase
MRFDRALFIAGAALSASACATLDQPGPGAVVRATAETVAVGTANEDAADDPVIWTASRPFLFGGQRIAGFVAGTDKKAGLYIYGLDGSVLQFLPDGLLNNVDYGSLDIGGRPHAILGASDRTPGREGVALYRFDMNGGGQFEYWGHIASDLVEPYGFCMRDVDGVPNAVLIGKDGQVRHFTLAVDAAGAPSATEVRRFAVGSISEGCTLDVPNRALFISEELVGLWRYSLDPARGDQRTLVERANEGRLRADVEGVTIITDVASGSRYLIASSQGDSGFGVWRLGGQGATEWVGRFAVHGGAVDEVTGTDGIDAMGGAVGPYPEGLVVVQDDVNPGAPQNFKYIDWREVKTALGL